MFRSLAKGVAAFALLALLLPAPSAQAAPMELLVSTIMMENHPTNTAFTLPFFRSWEEMSGNAIKITYFNPGTICAANEMIPSAEKGVIAMTIAPLGAYPAIFPGSSFAGLPLLFSNSRAASLTIAEAFTTVPQLVKELENWKVLMATTSVPANLLTVKKPVRTMEDLKGMKIATTTNDGMEVLKSLGATPVQVQLNDMYLALQRGMVDGCLTPAPTWRSTKVTEVAKYVTVCNMQLSPTPLLMSRATWNSLPQAARDVMDRIGLTAMSAAGGVYPDYFGVVDTQWVVENHKVQLYTLPGDELARWRQAVAGTHGTWIERAKRQGVENPEGLLEAVKAIAAKYSDLDTQKAVLQSYRDVLGSIYPTQERLDLVWGND
jgi:TRAP-type C4-dicarboxylate transport system substrate-binding protein